MFYAGFDKLNNGFDASGYLINATSGPFAETFASLAGNSLVNFLVVWGEILIGFSLMAGALVKFSSLMGIIMMILFYLSSFPPEHGLVSEHIIYALVFFVLITHKAGSFLGVDQYFMSLESVKKNRFAKLLIG